MVGREPINGADNSWRRLSRVDNLTTITGVLTFEERLTYEELVDQLERRLLRFDRFKQRLGGHKRTIRRPYWEEIEDFDIHTHIYEINLPEPKGKAELQEFIGTLMSRPLDERRPLWEAYLLDEYEDGTAVVFRLDHSLGDGFALLYVLFGLADNPHDIRFPVGGLSVPELPEAERQEREASTPDGGATTAPATATESADDKPAASTESSAEADTAATTERQSATTASGSWSTIRDGLTLAGTTAKVAFETLFMDDEPQTSLHDDIGTAKRAAWSNEIDLATVKAIGDACDATVNDIVLAATAGVFRRTLEARGESTEGLDLRCTVPVNLKPMDRRDESLGNYFGLAFIPIPVGERDLETRIELIRERANPQKLGIQAYLLYQTLSLGGYVPEQVFNAVLPLFADNATAVVSNVPGPMDDISIAGKTVDKIMFWNPQAMDQGLSVSIFTYDGGVRVGISGDANLVPDPEAMTDAFEDEIAQLETRYVS